MPVTARFSTTTPPSSVLWSSTFAPSSTTIIASSSSSLGWSTTQDPKTTSSPTEMRSNSTQSKKSMFTRDPIFAPSMRNLALSSSVFT